MRFEQYLKTPKVSIRNSWIQKMMKASVYGDVMSEIICMIFDEENVSLEDLFDEMEEYMPLTDTIKLEKKRKDTQKQIMKVTQQALDTRGLPDEFTVFRGGDPHSEYSLIPVSLDPAAAYNFTKFGSGNTKPLYMYKIKKSDIIADVAAIRGPGKGFENEQELLVYKSSLRDPKRIEIKPGWWKELD